MGKAALWSACQEQKTKCKNTSSGFLDGLVLYTKQKKRQDLGIISFSSHLCEKIRNAYFFSN